MLALGLKFTITTLGVLQYYLGINITTYGNTVTLDQRKYIQEICNEHQITPIPVSTPVATTPSADTTTLPEQEATVVRRMMGALVYIAVMTRPDISFAVSAASRHLHNPRVCDRVAIVRIHRCLLCALCMSCSSFSMFLFAMRNAFAVAPDISGPSFSCTGSSI